LVSEISRPEQDQDDFKSYLGSLQLIRNCSSIIHIKGANIASRIHLEPFLLFCDGNALLCDNNAPLCLYVEASCLSQFHFHVQHFFLLRHYLVTNLFLQGNLQNTISVTSNRNSTPPEAVTPAKLFAQHFPVFLRENRQLLKHTR